jgi:serine/threonine-protein kinase
LEFPGWGTTIFLVSDQAFDQAVARYLEEMGMATPEQIRTGMEAQLDLAAKGTPVPFTEALIRIGILTPLLRENIENIVRSRKTGPGQFSQYKLLDKLGEGGMGEVYLALDTSAGRKVAIKVLPRKYSDDPDFVARFRREAEAASKLRHVNIVGAFASGLELGYCFYVMEYCDGEPLDKRLRREGRLPWSTAVRLVMHAARGLHYAHQHGFIHRDVKPANIMGMKDGTAKILDLGLSKNLAEKGASFTTVTGAVMGTPHYIAPEQANAGPVDARADIYSLGATLYHLVTGTTPFSGATPVEILYKQVHAQLPNPQDLVEELPDTLLHVLRKMMAKEPADRYPDGEGCLLDLEEVLAGRAPSTNILEPAKSAVALVRARPPKKRATLRRSEVPPARRVTGILVGAAAGLLGLMLFLLFYRSGDERPPAPLAAPDPHPSAPTAPSRPPEPAAPTATLEPWKNGKDLMPLIDVSKDAVTGVWSKRGGDLRVEAGLRARLEIPYAPSEQYDFRVVFTRIDGNDCTTQFVSLGNQPFLWQMGAAGNTAFAFERVRFQPLETNPTARRVSRCLELGRRYESTLVVRQNAVTAFLDGAPIAQWTSNLKDLSRDPAWALRDETLLGLGASETTTLFHSIEVREVFGRGRTTRAHDADAPPWRPIWDGRSTEVFNLIQGSWTIDGEALEGTADSALALGLETRKIYKDADFRLRFETRAVGYLEIGVRSGPTGKSTVTFNRPELGALGRGPYVVTFHCQGDVVEAGIEGQRRPLKERGSAPSGSFLIHARGEGLRILSLEVREAAAGAPEWRTLADGRSLEGLAPKSQETWRLKDGTLEPLRSGAFSLVTRDEVPDGDIRVVMEARELAYLVVDARLTPSGKTRAMPERSVMGGLERRKFEILLRCRGGEVTGTIGGHPLSFSVPMPTTSGALRLEGEGSGVRVHSIFYRPLR